MAPLFALHLLDSVDLPALTDHYAAQAIRKFKIKPSPRTNDGKAVLRELVGIGGCACHPSVSGVHLAGPTGASPALPAGIGRLWPLYELFPHSDVDLLLLTGKKKSGRTTHHRDAIAAFLRMLLDLRLKL